MVGKKTDSRAHATYMDREHVLGSMMLCLDPPGMHHRASYTNIPRGVGHDKITIGGGAVHVQARGVQARTPRKQYCKLSPHADDCSAA